MEYIFWTVYFLMVYVTYKVLGAFVTVEALYRTGPLLINIVRFFTSLVMALFLTGMIVRLN